MRQGVKFVTVLLFLNNLAGCNSADDQDETQNSDPNDDTVCDGTGYFDKEVDAYVTCHPVTQKKWLKCALGQKWNPKKARCEDNASLMTYLEAQDACPKGYGLPTNDDMATVLCNLSDEMIPDCPSKHYDSCSECSICALLFPEDNGHYLSDDSELIFDGGAYSTWVFSFEMGCVTEDGDPGGNEPWYNVRCIEMD